MANPTDSELARNVGSKYSLVIAVAKRAKQLRDGAPRLVECKSKNLITIALEEIAAGKVNIITATQEGIDALSRPDQRSTRPQPSRDTTELLKVPDAEVVEAEEAPVELSAEEPEEIALSAEDENEDLQDSAEDETEVEVSSEE